jgi:SynChlorMet cassette protein ScmD
MMCDTKPIANPQVVLREESDNWALLFNPDTADVIVINPAGVTIWKMMNGKNDIEDILIEIKNCFSEVAEDAKEHVILFIKDLQKRGLVGFEII